MGLRGKKVLVVGLGISGQSVVRFLQEEGARVTATDRRRLEEVENADQILPLDIHWGSHPNSLFELHVGEDVRDLLLEPPGLAPVDHG